MKALIVLITGSFLLLSCNQETPPSETEVVSGFEGEEGFDRSASDPEALLLAGQVLEASGGREAWKKARHFRWTFFGRRTLWWDKEEHKCRLYFPEEELTLLVDLKRKWGRVARGDSLLMHPDTVQQYMEFGYKVWVNDSYWLVMPFKMMDPGVQLRYIGEDTTDRGDAASVMAMTFDEVGVTPQNKYHVYVDAENKLVRQWDYFRLSTDTLPALSTPWLDYREYAGLQLSSNRGEGMQLTDIAVFPEVDSTWYTQLDGIEPRLNSN